MNLDNSRKTLEEAARLRREFKTPWMEMYNQLIEAGYSIYRQNEDEPNFAMKHLNYEVLKLYPELRTNKRAKKKRGRKKGSKNKTKPIVIVKQETQSIAKTNNAKIVASLRAAKMNDADIIDVLIKL